MMDRRKLLGALLASGGVMPFAKLSASTTGTSEEGLLVWQGVLANARGQEVFWHAWGGDPKTNAFIQWAGEQTEARYGVRIRHVALSDTAEAVARVLAEREAGKNSGGAVDLIWINGPNFASMKQENLLYGPFAHSLPNAHYIDYSEGSAASKDFTIPTEGYESPWRLAKFVYLYNSENISDPAFSAAEMLAWAQENPGRMTHPVVTNFMGSTFLKQAMLELTGMNPVLYEAPDPSSAPEVLQPLWEWYAQLRPVLWRRGAQFPENESAQFQLLNDNEVDVAMSFDPAAAAAGIARGSLPESTRVFVPELGSIGNLSFVAIPFNAAHRAGAMVVADFLISPEAQAHMQNIDVLGSFSVLDPSRLGAEDQVLFAALPEAPALPKLEALGPTLLEPHPGWMTLVTEEWLRQEI